MTSRAVVLAPCLALVVLAGACTRKVYVDRPVASTTAAAPPAAAAPRTEDTSSASTGGVPTQSSPPKSSPLALEQRHPNGSVLKLTGISFAATSITLNVEAVNGFTSEVKLNSRGSIYLVDDAGNRYNFAAPEQNKQLAIAPGATLRGSFTFLSPVAKEATRLKLLVNVYSSDTSVDLAVRYDRTTSPEFDIDVPIQP